MYNFLKVKAGSDAITFAIGREVEAVGVTAATFLLLPDRIGFRINLVGGPLVTSGKSAFGS